MDTKSFNDMKAVAGRGTPEEQFRIGLRYSKGDGVQRNERDAEKWFLKAARRGHAKAQGALGFYYACRKRDGFKYSAHNDFRLSVRWYLRAAKRGNVISQHNLANLYADGMGTKADYAKAAKWHLKAAEKGDTWSQKDLSTLYAEGKGLPQSFARAVDWALKAVSNWTSGNDEGSDGYSEPHVLVLAHLWCTRAGEKDLAYSALAAGLEARMTKAQLVEASTLVSSAG